jgi:putative Mn2+ efflux pump MntP
MVSLSLGLTNFAAAIGIGLSGVDGRTRLKTALVFGFFEALMPIVGLVIGRAVASDVGDMGRYVGGFLLIATGAYIVAKALRQKHDSASDAGPHEVRLQQLVPVAFALSLDNLLVGFALSFWSIPIVVAVVVIAAVSVCMSLIGLEIGDLLGERVEQWSEEVGGVVLILVGIAVGVGLF